MLGLGGKSKQAADLADGFHNLPKDMWKDDFSLERFRDDYLAVYQKKYPKRRPYNYVRAVNQILASEEDISGN